MCTPNTELQFCTCTEGDIYETKDIYIWALYRYHGSREPLIRGKVMMPVKDFENGISAENMISKVNHENIFDFDYTPQERDTLYISFNAKNRTEYKYFTLIFRDGVWQKGNNPVFGSIEEEIAKGKIKVIYKEENIFLKHCEYLKDNYGIKIPESIKVRCANLKDDSPDPIYLAIKNFKEYKIFYRQEFIKYVVKTYFKIYSDENSDRLQTIINSAQNKFSLLENKFISKTENLAFLNRCFKDLNKDVEKCFTVAIPIGDKEYLFIDGHLIGRTGFKSKRNNKYYKSKLQKIKFEDFELFRDY